MRDIGFSTGALAFGDFRKALTLLHAQPCPVVELSALRDVELPTLMAAVDELDIANYRYVSVHAPSKFRTMTERQVAKSLLPCIDRRWPVILHPDAIGDPGCWREFGRLLCLENMDKRKSSGRTADELAKHFDSLPEASLCLDLGHAKQVDPTLGIARHILRQYGDRLVQIHLSELDATCHHARLSMATVWAIREITSQIPDAPVILESVIPAAEMSRELEMAQACFEQPMSARATSQRSEPANVAPLH
jgi:hypothetical protein